MLLEEGAIDIRVKDIADYFNVSEGTVSKKSRDIRVFMEMEEGDEEWKVESIYKYGIFEKTLKNYNLAEDFQELIENFMETDNENLQLLNDIYSDIENNNYKEAERKLKELLIYEEDKLGEKFIKENKGDFWLIPETREYMEMRVDYADVLWLSGKKNESLEVDKGTLELNPNDNQGVRDWAIFKAVNLRDFDYAKKLFKDYEEDRGATMLLGKILYNYSLGDMKKAKENAESLKDHNPYIKDYIIEKKRIPLEEPFFYGYGDENEAIIAMTYAKDAINETLGFKKWVKENM